MTVTGPRQSGKTTLIKEVFKSLPYISLENSYLIYAGKNDAILPYGNLTSWNNLDIIDLD